MLAQYAEQGVPHTELTEALDLAIHTLSSRWLGGWPNRRAGARPQGVAAAGRGIPAAATEAQQLLKPQKPGLRGAAVEPP